MRSVLRRTSLCAPALAAALAGCGGDGGIVAIDPAELIGTWAAGKFEFVSKANSFVRIDLVGSLGAIVTLDVASTTYTLEVIVPGVTTETQMGTWSVAGDQLIIESATSTDTLTATLSGNTLTLEAVNAEFDFNQDGADEPATFQGIFTRIMGPVALRRPGIP
jgi:hypothetical protein